MTLQDFFNKYNGQGVDFDGAYGNQCVDLAQFYNHDVVGAPRLTGNAVDIWNTYPKDFYDRIANTPTNAPVAGDIIIWGASVGGGFGHIAICQSAGVSAFTSFDQNWPTGSKVHFQSHDYKGVLGWLHLKKSVQPQPQPQSEDQQAVIDQLRADRDKNWNLYQEQLGINTQLQAKITQVKEFVSKI